MARALEKQVESFAPEDIASLRRDVARLNLDYLMYVKRLAQADLDMAQRVFRQVPVETLKKLADLRYSQVVELATIFSVWPFLEPAPGTKSAWIMIDGYMGGDITAHDLAMQIANMSMRSN